MHMVVAESLAATSLSTMIGALPAMMLTGVTHRGKDIIIAYTAGIMVSASTYGLIPSALKLSNLIVLAAGMLLGTILLTMLEMFVPHEDPGHSKAKAPQTASSFLFLSAMALHNLPEGLSVGVSYGSEDRDLGAIVALSIGFQNVPEGFLTALYLITRRMNKWSAMLLATLTGLVELLFCWIGYAFSGNFTGIVPYGLAFAAGAMLFVVYKELIPESHGDGNERTSTFSFIFGLLTMIGITHLLK